MEKDYTELITSEHAGSPKYSAMVGAVSAGWGDITDFLQALPGEFDLDTCIGKQLDTVGRWVGISRTVNVPITGVYFSFDTAGLGFEQGYIKGRYDPDEGPTSMDDETYRKMIRAKIGANHWDGTTYRLQEILEQVFTGTGTIAFCADNQDMSNSVCVMSELPDAITAALLKGGHLSIKPAGVRINGYYKPSIIAGPFFGFDVGNSYVAGFDTGAIDMPL